MKTLDARQVARIYDERAATWRRMAVFDSLLGINRLRRSHFAGATGAVLDVGCGTGENFRHLAAADSITAVDISHGMIREAGVRARELGIDVELRPADAAALPYPDDSFDTVISALSTCTFPSHVDAFHEMERVVRPGGQILLLEHGRSRVAWVARRQDRGLERRFRYSACRSNRDPRHELAEAGLVVDRHVTSHLGTISRFGIQVS